MVGEAKTQNRLIPHPPMMVKNRVGYLGCGGTKGSQTHIQSTSCQEEESLQYLAVKISRGSVWVRLRSVGDPGILLKCLSTDLLTHKHLPQVPEKGQQLEKCQGHKGTWIIWLQLRAGGVALSWTEILECTPLFPGWALLPHSHLVDTIVPMLSPSPAQPTGAGSAKSDSPISLT